MCERSRSTAEHPVEITEGYEAACILPSSLVIKKIRIMSS